MSDSYYKFISAKQTNDKISVTLRKHAGELLWGLFLLAPMDVGESEQGCVRILNAGKRGLAEGEKSMSKYNIREMTKALNAIRRLK